MTFRGGSAAGLLLLAAGCADPAAPGASGKRAIDRVAIAPLRAFTPPKPARHVLANGLTVFLLPDRTLPIVSLSGMVRTGSIRDPKGKEGLAKLCAESMRAGGSKRTGGDSLDTRLESIGAQVDLSMGLDSAGFSAVALAEDFSGVLRLLAEVLTEPAFPQDKIDLCRMEMLGALSRQNDDPDTIAARVFPQLLYGKDHPLAREETIASVRAATREDLAAFHTRNFQPESAIVGVSGDFDPEKMLALLMEVLGAWKRGGNEPLRMPDVDGEPKGAVFVAARLELNQSTVMLGHLGTVRRSDDPDLCAITVMDAILGGGGFSSRLMQIVRAKEGLAYSVWSDAGMQFGYRGILQVGCQTKCEATAQAIRSMEREIRRIREEPVTAEELAIAKESTLNATAFFYASRAQIVSRAVRYEHHGFPQDWIDRYLKGIAAVTAEDVRRVALRYLRPESLTILVVGNPERFAAPLSEFGEVRKVELPGVETPK